ncbi:MAG: hypothetical protein GY725_13820 [bacterium]|nr:hypothetical protein [bacterium]
MKPNFESDDPGLPYTGESHSVMHSPVSRVFSRTCATLLLALAVLASPPYVRAGEPEDDPLLELGTEDGHGGEDFMKYDRDQIKKQVKTFIPPLLSPAFTQHAFVLPPGLFRMGLSHRIVSIDGNDFFKNGNTNRAVFANSEVDRELTDLDIFYGFDLNREYLHAFTVRLNIPYKNSRVRGYVHPGGLQALNAHNTASTQELGDIGLFLKKKLMDQGNGPIGIAAVGAVFFPTGDNDERYGNDGTIMMQMPPAAPTSSIFGRFSDDGRLPSTLQPGTGSFSYLGGMFLTRQFDWRGLSLRGAFHLGATYRLVFKEDGVDPGDTATYFASLVMPIRKDFLSADLTCIVFDHEDDSYSGTFMDPVLGVIPRPDFSGGTTGFIAPSLIFSPDPQFRVTLSALLRVKDPDLGPAPQSIIRLGFSATF